MGVVRFLNPRGDLDDEEQLSLVPLSTNCRAAGSEARRHGRGSRLVGVLVIAFHMLKRKESYRELGADHFDRIDVSRLRRSLVRRLERLGHRVTLKPLTQTA